METAAMVIGVFVAVGLYFIGYYKGRADSWTEAYYAGEKSGWNQSQRRLL